MSKQLKYIQLINSLEPGFTRSDYDTAIKSARHFVKSIKMQMSSPLTPKNIILYRLFCLDQAIKSFKKNLKDPDEVVVYHAKSDIAMFERQRQVLPSMLRSFEKRGLTGLEAFTEMVLQAGDEGSAEKIYSSNHIKTMGDFFIAIILIQRKQDEIREQKIQAIKDSMNNWNGDLGPKG